MIDFGAYRVKLEADMMSEVLSGVQHQVFSRGRIQQRGVEVWMLAARELRVGPWRCASG